MIKKKKIIKNINHEMKNTLIERTSTKICILLFLYTMLSWKVNYECRNITKTYVKLNNNIKNRYDQKNQLNTSSITRTSLNTQYSYSLYSYNTFLKIFPQF